MSERQRFVLGAAWLVALFCQGCLSSGIGWKVTTSSPDTEERVRLFGLYWKNGTTDATWWIREVHMSTENAYFLSGGIAEYSPLYIVTGSRNGSNARFAIVAFDPDAIPSGFKDTFERQNESPGFWSILRTVPSDRGELIGVVPGVQAIQDR